ncbi:MAG: hypothetical protein HKO66_09960, partial [Saprospiraceae bacterium]|nr:hypothetical protein [Saprospiraceae bacterium]
MAIKATENYSPGILSLLPLYYVGWSDSVLSPTEIKFIHDKIDSYSFLNPDEKTLLKSWADPLNPPSPTQFKSWGNAIKAHSKNIDDNKKSSLIELGIEMARQGIGLDANNIWQAKDTRDSLIEFKEILGVNAESEHLFVNKLFPEIVIDDTCTVCEFDSNELKMLLDGEHIELKDRVRQLLRDPFFDQTYEPNKDIYRQRILEQTKKLAAQGLSAYSFPKKYGGYEKNGDHIA